MDRRLLNLAFPFLLCAGLTLSHTALAAPHSQENPKITSKALSLKRLSEQQTKISEALVSLEAKYADKAASSTDKNVIDQANLIRKANEEAKQAAEDLGQATTLLKE